MKISKNARFCHIFEKYRFQSIFSKNFDTLKHFNFCQIFKKVRFQSKFFENFDIYEKIRNFSKILTKIEIFRKFD